MDLTATPIKTMKLMVKHKMFKFGVFTNTIMMSYIKKANLMVLFMGGLYYNSSMTSLAPKVKEMVPNSINTKIAAARNFMRLDSESKLYYFKNVYLASMLTKLYPNAGKEVVAKNQKKEDAIADHLSVTPLEDFDSTPVDIVQVTADDLKQFKDEIVDDVVSGALSGAEKAGLRYLDLTFREEKVHRALIDVLNEAIREESFIKKSRDFGIDLVNESIQDPKFQKNIKQHSLDVLQCDDVKLASVDLLKCCINHNTVQSFVKVLMREVMTKTEANPAMISTLVESVIQAVQKDETVLHLGKLFNTTAAIDVVGKEAKNSILYKNMYSWVPFKGKASDSMTDDLSEAVKNGIKDWVNQRNTI
jgi:hypothetical protein